VCVWGGCNWSSDIFQNRKIIKCLFDETNGSQKEQADLDLVDDEEAPCDALQRIAIGDIRPQDPSDQLHGYTPSDTTSPAQWLDQDEHEGEDEHHDQVQEKSNDQGGKG
jgi:hypothetical protein